MSSSMIKLFVMRHGEAEVFAASDGERELTERGIVQAQRAGAWLAERAPGIPLLYQSPFRRARQTAAEVARCFPGIECRELDALTPSGRPEVVVQALERAGVDSLLCVSHQPLVGELRNWLVDGSEGAGYPFATASIALLECEYLAPGGASMRWIVDSAGYA